MINFDKLIDTISTELCDGVNCKSCPFMTESGGCRVEEWVERYADGDAVEVVHGHWIVLQNRAVESICYWSEEQKKADKKGAGTMAKCKCSNCNWRTNFMGYVKTGIENMFNYCPNCGAKMDEVTE